MTTSDQTSAVIDEASYLAQLAAARLASWPKSAPREASYPLGEISMGEILRQRAKATPDKLAVEFYGAKLSYGALDRLSEQFANLLSESGVKTGDSVAIYLQNCPQYFVAFYGILKLGAVFVPVNPMFLEPELRHELRVSGARVIVAQDQLLAQVRKVAQDCPLDHVFSTAMIDMLPENPVGPLPSVLSASREDCAGTTDLLAALRDADSRPVDVVVDLDGMAALNFTGGTTGLPKACVHTQRDMLYTCATGGLLCYELDETSVVICFAPLFWIAGEGIGLLMPIYFGASLVLQARWDAVAFTSAVARHRVTHTYMLVDNAIEILDNKDCDGHDLSSLKFVKTASFVNRNSPELRSKWRERTGANLHEVAWGMTETHTYDFFTSGFQDGDRDLGYDGVFVGLCVPGTEVKILDFETGALVPMGEVGEIVLRSPSVTKTYLTADGTPEPALDAGGWFKTGDSGMVNKDGTMCYLGRRKELIKVKGMSVFPSELEMIIATHPAVTKVAVVPRPSPTHGQIPVAFVTLNSAGATTPEALTEWAKTQFSGYKQPEFRVIDSFPVTFSGKVRKNELIALYIGT